MLDKAHVIGCPALRYQGKCGCPAKRNITADDQVTHQCGWCGHVTVHMCPEKAKILKGYAGA